MIELADEDKLVEVEYQATIATAAYENLKPCIRMKCKQSEIEQTLLLLRSRLSKEYKNIKSKGKNNEDKN